MLNACHIKLCADSEQDDKYINLYLSLECTLVSLSKQLNIELYCINNKYIIEYRIVNIIYSLNYYFGPKRNLM